MGSAVAEPTHTETLATLTVRSAAHHATHVSGEAIAIAAVGAVIVLACLAWALARTLAFEPRWTLSLRHAVAEAGFRASATWAEFSDWARLGH
jgi:hypothetical protein